MSKAELKDWTPIKIKEIRKKTFNSQRVDAVLEKARIEIVRATGRDCLVEAIFDGFSLRRDKTTIVSINVHSVINACISSFGIPWEQLMYGGRKDPIVKCRMAISYLCVKHYKIASLNKVAAELNLKNHTSILHHLDVFPDLIQTDPTFDANYFKAIEILEIVTK